MRYSEFAALPPATCPLKLVPASAKKPWLAGSPAGSFSGSSIPKAPVAQLDRALPSEGRGHRFESCRVRQLRQLPPTSKRELVPRNQSVSSAAAVSTAPARNAHSHTTATLHPAIINSPCFRRSRSTVETNFDCQNSSRVPGVVANLQSSCRCQKQPCTKQTAPKRGKTISGRPGSLVV